jgi:hypothetical protein
MLKRSHFDMTGLRGQRLRGLVRPGLGGLVPDAVGRNGWDHWTLQAQGLQGTDAHRLALAMEVLHAWVFYVARVADIHAGVDHLPVLELGISEEMVRRCQESAFSEMGGHDLLMFPHSTSFVVLREAEGPTHYAGVPHFVAIVRGDPGSLGPGITNENLPPVRPWGIPRRGSER